MNAIAAKEAAQHHRLTIGCFVNGGQRRAVPCPFDDFAPVQGCIIELSRGSTIAVIRYSAGSVAFVHWGKEASFGRVRFGFRQGNGGKKIVDVIGTW